MKQEQTGINNFVQIGLFGGVFWGSIWYFLHIFSFTEVGTNYLLLPFALGDWKEGVWGNIAGIICIGFFSIVVAFLYKTFFKKFEGVLPGLLYGLFWWSLLFLGLGSIAPVIKNAMHLPKETVTTTICIFILYGVFISYSVSFEANNVNQGEDAEKTNYSNK
ncbi:YqhR family membrane protein [Bacillus cytotoxicus]|uniref:YqhR family membrane protein n=1 Tax=Bacillus cytotoxicus TaxID=580165 RepID=UPI003D7DC6D7